MLSSNDYFCDDCRKWAEGQMHEWVGKTVVSIVNFDDMRGITLHFDDGSSFNSIYSKFVEAT